MRNSSINVLCIDDNIISRLLVVQMLSKLGYTIFEASDGLSGLKLLQEHPEIEWVVLDLEMPILDGYEFLKVVNINCYYANLRIIVNSSVQKDAYLHNIEDRKIPTDKVCDFVSKPYDSFRIDQILQNAHASGI